ncbi:AtpZ/AtpI family protein [Abyssalbus ytuae]|uniref:AtpZ/AtpI family protein n=1 Tax=Abyssalbus ytuae TaxID=2926907 RepID=A0A9E6ZK48_9FLAO|nr:AtpZ/AtpI family protein [Abyssalbus ytuae]UOB16009.1 AtpZ/AtpI family protein [Abyssalbus ytuae]
MNKKPKKQLKNLALLSGIAFQMGATIYLGAYGGKWLDAHYNTTEKKPFTIVCTLLAVGISLYIVLQQVKKLHK